MFLSHYNREARRRGPKRTAAWHMLNVTEILRSANGRNRTGNVAILLSKLLEAMQAPSFA